MHDRDRLAPVSLAVECPVFHLILYTLLTDAAFFQFLKHAFDGILFICIAIQKFRVDHLAVAGVRFFLDVAAFDDLDNVDTKFLRKIVVSLVMCRYCHDRAGTVTHHYVICDKDRDLLAVDRIDRGQTVDAHARLILYKLRTLKLCFLCTLIAICLNRIKVADTVFVLIDQRMLRCDYHEGNAVKGIRSRRVNAKLIFNAVYREIHKCSCRFSDPVYLLLLDVCRIIHRIKSLQKLIRIFGDPQIPYILGTLYDIAVADIAFSALAVLVGKNDLTGRAVIYQCLVAEYKALLKHFQKDPLCPFIEIRICRIDHAAPVKGESNAFQLFGEAMDVFVCDDTRMGRCLDRIVLRRKSECIKSDREQYIVAFHAALSRNYLNTGVCFDMANVHSCTARIRELYQTVKFRLFAAVNCFEDLLIGPFFLPFRLDFLKLMSHCDFLRYGVMYVRNLNVHCMSGKLVNQKTPLGIYSQETEGLFFRGTTLFHDLHALIGYEFSHILPG